MSTTTQPLEYRFVAIYKDGTFFEQPLDDKSKDHVEAAEWNPSAFRDIDQDELQYFILIDKMDKPVIVVNLETGFFRINYQWVQLHDQNDIPKDLKLIYFREVRKEFIDGEEQEAYVSKYFVGWETTKGKKIKRTVGL